MQHNLKNDRAFLRRIEIGHISVTKSGVVINHRSNRKNKVIGSTGSGGYPKISLSWKVSGETVIKHMQIHRLVWLVYRGEIPEGYLINHKDGNKQNPRLTNLELVTLGENVRHAIRMGLSVPRVGEQKPNAVFLDADVRKMRRLYATGKYSVKDIATMFCANVHSARSVLTYRTYTHI